MANTAFEASARKIFKETTEVGFELLGFDFMIDKQLNAWLIEVNTNPCLSTLTNSQDGLIKRLVEDTLKITVDPIFGLRPDEDASDEPRSEFVTNYELLYIHFSGN